MKKAGLFLVSIVLFAVMQARGQDLVFRPEPSFNSQPDTSSRYYDAIHLYGVNVPSRVLEYTETGWVKVQREKYVEKKDKNGKHAGGKFVKVVEYIDLESLNPYVLKKDCEEIKLHSKPNINSPVVLIISSGDFGSKYAEFPDNDKRKEIYDSPISGPKYNIIGSVKKEWIQFRVIIEMRQRGKSWEEQSAKERKEWLDNLRNLKSIPDTIYGYFDRQSFESNMELIPVYSPSLKERAGEYIDELIDDMKDFFRYRMNLRKNFPKWILILLGLNLIILFALNWCPKIQLLLDYITLLSVFILELIYIIIMESEFWWCNPSDVGWIKAILFFLLSLGLVVYQFFKFFYLINRIQEETRPFNTFVGIILFAVIFALIFIYAIFGGEFSDKANRTLTVILIGTQVLQVIITTIQLRKYPLYALMVLLLFPLGVFAILCAFLRLFAFLCLFGLIGLVIYCFGASGSNHSGSDTSSTGRKRGDAEHCKYCDYPYCTFGGHNHSCSLINTETCQHGQM
jgi:hypothetical protein